MISINNLCVIQEGNSSINEGPLNTWTIPPQCQDTTSFTSTDTVRNYGKGGHYERVYKAFTVNTTGTAERSQIPSSGWGGAGA